PRRPHDPRQARGREATHVLQGSRRRGPPPRPRARPKRRTPVMRVRGDGSVFRRGRFWHYVFWLDGEPHQGSTLLPIDPTADGARGTKATRIGARSQRYVADRRAEGGAWGSIRIELALLNRAFRLAVKKKRLSARSRPDIELPPEDPNAIREGFFRRADV